jgi:quinoprotein glucose dehydrogenase
MRRKGPMKASVRAAVAALPALAFAAGAAAQEWPSYGGDPGGQRFSGATQITPQNVGRLVPAWTFHTGERRRPGPQGSSFEDTPILADGRLLVCTPTDRVFALNPLTGRAIWAFDPKLSPGLRPGSGFLCRGVAVCRDGAAAPGADCGTRVVLATLDLRVIELDLATGRPCAGFGERGTVRVAPAWPPRYPGAMAFDSPPAVINDTLVVGSALDDMTEARPSGSAVRGLDARTGALGWRFDPEPRSPTGALESGGGNVCAPIAADPATGRVFLPAASPTATFYGGERPGDDKFASSVVALDGTTGTPVWSFQATHHDIWDYDVAAQPSLVTLRNGRDRSAVVVATKMGFVFVLDRDTGRPLFPVAERAVPASDVPGEAAAPTQPVPSAPPPLVPQRLAAGDAWGVAFVDRWLCRRQIEKLRSDGLYTPPSLRGTIIYPFTGGGVNWGGGAFDPKDDLYIVNTMNVAHVVRLIPRAEYAAARAAQRRDRPRAWHALCRRAHAAVLYLRRSLQPAALGHPRGDRSRHRHDPLAGAARLDGVRAHPRPAEPRRADRHRERPRFHRRSEGRQAARLRRPQWPRIVAGAAAGRRPGDADDLCRRRAPVRGHRSRRACANGHQIRRRGRRLLAPRRRSGKLTRSSARKSSVKKCRLRGNLRNFRSGSVILTRVV